MFLSPTGLAFYPDTGGGVEINDGGEGVGLVGIIKRAAIHASRTRWVWSIYSASVFLAPFFSLIPFYPSSRDGRAAPGTNSNVADQRATSRLAH